MISSQDTIAALATPVGEGGIGVIRVSGSESIPAVDTIFRSAKITHLSQAASHTCWIGKLYANKGKEPPEVIDQVVVTVFRAPHSYTGEDVVEISAHGNPLLLDRILRACLNQGARLAGPGEFTERAFLSGKMDLTQAEAVADLIRAKTDKGQAAAVAQMEGRLAGKIRGLRDRLLPLLAHVEVGLDHSDEDHDFLKRQQLISGCQALEEEIAAILDSAPLGKVLRDGLRVALLGKPNVGKSSLLNSLLNEERAIVTPVPGTTRDTLEETLNWDGIPVVLTDTAGLREYTGDPIEELGIARSRKAAAAADLILGIFDGSGPFSSEDKQVIKECAAFPHIWVVNKSDLPSQWNLSELARLNGGAPAIQISAKTGAGLSTLIRKVKETVLAQSANSGEAGWVLNLRHQDALSRTQEALKQAREAAKSAAFEECVALELQSALRSLGEIIGETPTEELLGQIFSQFCVGK